MSDRLPDGCLAALREMAADSLGRAAADEILRLRESLRRVSALAAHPDPDQACGDIIAFAQEALGEEGEAWREVGAHPGYEVSTWGRVRSRWSARILRSYASPGGYLRVLLYGRRREGRQSTRQVLVHTLVLEAFVGPKSVGMEAAHLDGCRTNNAIKNLVWATPKENAGHREWHGTDPQGSRNGYAKLTEEIVSECRRQHAAGASIRELARRHGVSPSAMRKAITGKRWGHVA